MNTRTTKRRRRRRLLLPVPVGQWRVLLWSGDTQTGHTILSLFNACWAVWLLVWGLPQGPGNVAPEFWIGRWFWGFSLFAIVLLQWYSLFVASDLRQRYILLGAAIFWWVLLRESWDGGGELPAAPTALASAAGHSFLYIRFWVFRRDERSPL